MIFEDREFVANAIKMYREQKGLTQLQLAELANLSEQHVSKLENAVYQPSAITLLKLVKILEIDLKIFGIEEKSDSAREKMIKLVYNSSSKENEMYYEVLSKLRDTYSNK